MNRWVVICALLAAPLGCGGKATRGKVVASNARIGDCADPQTAGVLSDDPALRTAHRDLNGDGVSEEVFADRNLCKAGNCSWNLFTKTDDCSRYIGTVSGATLEVDPTQGEAGFSPVHAWWKLPSGSRYLVQSYRYREGGYQLSDVLICRQSGDDRLVCASEEPHAVLHD